MTNDEFARRITGMMDTLYRVSYALLPQGFDRDDAVQECLRKAWQKRDHLRDERYMQTWVTRILINECHNLRKRRQHLPLDGLPERPAPPGADIALHDALLALDEPLRMPIVLHYIEGYSIGEISAILRLPQGTVKTRMAKARRELKSHLEWEGARHDA